ncbi:hypothetical protein [Pseudomonas aeruginosa]|uniref:hypothetical protein n=1 Tax=Pseudomonas aeruginosa TaxID=287 RepID=UPI0029CA1E31|nr:hypothetical protein [Pseudomonas aeruginosa]
MNTPIFYELFRNHPLHAPSARTLASMLALGLALAGVWALLLGWGIGLGIDNFAMYFGWTALLMTILLVALFLGATLLRMEAIWLAFLLALPLLTSLTGCLTLVGAGPE